MIIKCATIDEEKVKFFDIEVDESNNIIVNIKLKQIHKDIVNVLKKYKEEEKIRSIYLPRDVNMTKEINRNGKKTWMVKAKKTDFQIHLDSLVKAKKTNKEAMDKIKVMFEKTL